MDCFHSLKLPLVNMLLATPSPFPHPKALPVSLPVSCVPVSNMPLPPRAALELSLGPLLVASQGMSSSYSGSAQSQGTTSQFAPGSLYDSLYCKCALSPQGVDRESTTVQSTRKQFTLDMAPSQGLLLPSPCKEVSLMIDHHGLKVLQVNLALCLSYPSVSSPSQGVSSQSTSVQFSRKQLASTYTGSSGTQAGSSPPFTPQGSTTYGGSPPPQDVASPFAPGPQSSYASLSLSAPQAGPSTTVQGSRKQFTSTFTGGSGTQSGSSTLLPLQGSTAYGGSPQRQDAASQLVRGWSAPYASVSLSSPQAVAGPSTVQGSRKRFTSPFTGGSGTQSGSSTPSPCREALLMVDHLKMSQVRFTLGLPHMQVCRCPHPKVLLVSPANHIKAILCLKARSLKNGSLQPLV